MGLRTTKLAHRAAELKKEIHLVTFGVMNKVPRVSDIKSEALELRFCLFHKEFIFDFSFLNSLIKGLSEIFPKSAMRFNGGMHTVDDEEQNTFQNHLKRRLFSCGYEAN